MVGSGLLTAKLPNLPEAQPLTRKLIWTRVATPKTLPSIDGALVVGGWSGYAQPFLHGCRETISQGTTKWFTSLNVQPGGPKSVRAGVWQPLGGCRQGVGSFGRLILGWFGRLSKRPRPLRGTVDARIYPEFQACFLSSARGGMGQSARKILIGRWLRRFGSFRGFWWPGGFGVEACNILQHV